MKKTKLEKGITLIALIITIVVLLILAVVAIRAVQGDGIIQYAQNAADDYTAMANDEQAKLNTLLSQIEGDNKNEETKVIPEGGTYKTGLEKCELCEYTFTEVESRCWCGQYTGVYTEEKTYQAGDNFPQTLQTGDTYTYGDYEYKYNYTYAGEGLNSNNGLTWSAPGDYNGWGVRLLNNTKPEYDDILTSIGGKNVVDMNSLFYNNKNITKAINIPETVTNIDGLYSGCTALKTYDGSTDVDGDFSKYVIPNNNFGLMYETFNNCTNMTKAPIIPSKTTSALVTFSGTGITETPTLHDGITSLDSTFLGCASLTTVKNIPNNISCLINTFYGCTELTGTITINATSLQSYSNCFTDTIKDITLVGNVSNQSVLEALAGTANNGNVKY